MGWYNSFRCMSVPSFKRENAMFLSLPLFNPLSLSEAAHTCLVAACLCTTLHLIDDPSELAVLSYTEDTRISTTRSLSELVEMCLLKSDWLQNHRIEWLQSFL